MKTKKCKDCQGAGFTYTVILDKETKKSGFTWVREVKREEVQCDTCQGTGRIDKEV